MSNHLSTSASLIITDQLLLLNEDAHEVGNQLEIQLDLYEDRLFTEEDAFITFLYFSLDLEKVDRLDTFMRRHFTASEDDRKAWVYAALSGFFLTASEAVDAPMTLLTNLPMGAPATRLDELVERVKTARTHLASLPMMESLDGWLFIEEPNSHPHEVEARHMARSGVQMIAPLAVNQVADAIDDARDGDLCDALEHAVFASAAARFALNVFMDAYHAVRCGTKKDSAFFSYLLGETNEHTDFYYFHHFKRDLIWQEAQRFHEFLLDAFPQA